jgi:hypothetical protein
VARHFDASAKATIMPHKHAHYDLNLLPGVTATLVLQLKLLSHMRVFSWLRS